MTQYTDSHFFIELQISILKVHFQDKVNRMISFTLKNKGVNIRIIRFVQEKNR